MRAAVERALRGVGLLVGTLAVVLLVGRARFERTTAQFVDHLDATADSRADEVFTPDDLDGVPEPVSRYLDAVIEDGRPYVDAVRLDQRGEFRLGGATGAWKPLEATQRFSVDPPGFVWDADIRFAPFVSTRVVDRYTDGEGSLRATLLSAVPVASADPGPAMNDAELQRYLAESVWFPTALLPTQGVDWEPIDDRSARATIEDRGNTASLVFHFSDADEVERVSTDRRYRQEDDSFAPWTGSFHDYRRRDGVHIPMDAEVAWSLPDGDQSYWRASVERIQYEPAR